MIHELNDHAWAEFCQRLTGQRAGATVKLEVTGADGIKSTKSENAILQSMVLDTADACSDLITLRLKGTREIVHEITEPVRIQLQAAGGTGDFNQISIEAEGEVTLITLHPGIHAKMLEGLKNS